MPTYRRPAGSALSPNGPPEPTTRQPLVALGLTFLHAAVVALASTAITSGAIWFIADMAARQA